MLVSKYYKNFNIFSFNDFFVFLVCTFFFPFLFIALWRVPNQQNNEAVSLTVSLIETIMEKLSNMNIFGNNDEKTILENNLKSLYTFQKIHDYKYCMIVMGSIIEFLLIKYCDKNNINPEPYNNPINGAVTPANRKLFCNYIQSAIKNDIFGQKKGWYLIQNNLRDFRNYVHISKETQEEKIDYEWFKAIKDVFDRIIRNFK